ncbi:VOC family protein [Herbiconiux sp. KACC 21604]|uniref:VOC family protein n=1 Tax=unclassified Herbiconiux TaxID=2618217 RepID=UPI001492FAFC|nr:VOC family protein [Herbiconiux sp. SALV-R1]QJU55251.1 VOC family protein [Herbiconiux sp. SALV-R1]WPO86418.1 VOC family protein [Herbiconiux sp. KACC 21604]
MSTSPVAHLNFHGQAREALEFYAGVFDGTTSIRTYGDFGMPAALPDADKVVFGRVDGADGFAVMAYDVPGAAEGSLQGGSTSRRDGVTITDQPFFLALDAPTLEAAELRWSALAVGATVVEPLAASAWSAGFGMLTDRFGVTWTVSVAG